MMYKYDESTSAWEPVPDGEEPKLVNVYDVLDAMDAHLGPKYSIGDIPVTIEQQDNGDYRIVHPNGTQITVVKGDSATGHWIAEHSAHKSITFTISIGEPK